MTAAFVAASEAEGQPAASVLRGFTQVFVKRRKQRVFEAEARQQSRMIAAHAHDPDSHEHAVMRKIEEDLDRDDFAGEWTA